MDPQILVAGFESGSALKMLIRIQEGKMTHKKKERNFMFYITGCSLLRPRDK
jgi:hypothetical protein